MISGFSLHLCCSVVWHFTQIICAFQSHIIKVPHMPVSEEEPFCPTSQPSPGWLTVLQGHTADSHLASHHQVLFCKATYSKRGVSRKGLLEVLLEVTCPWCYFIPTFAHTDARRTGKGCRGKGRPMVWVASDAHGVQTPQSHQSTQQSNQVWISDGVGS